MNLIYLSHLLSGYQENFLNYYMFYHKNPLGKNKLVFPFQFDMIRHLDRQVPDSGIEMDHLHTQIDAEIKITMTFIVNFIIVN